MHTYDMIYWYPTLLSHGQLINMEQ